VAVSFTSGRLRPSFSVGRYVPAPSTGIGHSWSDSIVVVSSVPGLRKLGSLEEG
jgi:hypothetical protein